MNDLRGHKLEFQNDVFLPLGIVYILANSVDPDEMPRKAFMYVRVLCKREAKALTRLYICIGSFERKAAFHQGLNCYLKYLFYWFPVQKWLTLCLLAPSADKFCEQFVPRSGPTFFGSKLWIQTLI